MPVRVYANLGGYQLITHWPSAKEIANGLVAVCSTQQNRNQDTQ